MRHDPRAGPQHGQQARSQAQVDLGQQVHRHHGGLADVGGEDVLRLESHPIGHAGRLRLRPRLLDPRGLEIEANERDLTTYRQRIDEYRNAIDLGRAQIGFGDSRYVEDEDVRRRFRELFSREVSMCAAGQGGEGAASYAKSIQPLLTRADVLDSRLESQVRGLDEQARVGADEISRKVTSELAILETSAQNLDTLDQQARLLVGEGAMKNFALVRDRLKSVVLRADVGIVQEAWELREEQRVRVRNLQRERSREENSLNDELREVLDDAAEDKE